MNLITVNSIKKKNHGSPGYMLHGAWGYLDPTLSTTTLAIQPSSSLKTTLILDYKTSNNPNVKGV